MTFDSSENNKDGTTTWTVSTAAGSSREEPRRLSFKFSTDELTSQEKQTRELVAGTKRRLKRRLARASETPEETAARQEEDAKRKRESREAARLKVNADDTEHPAKEIYRQRCAAGGACTDAPLCCACSCTPGTHSAGAKWGCASQPRRGRAMPHCSRSCPLHHLGEDLRRSPKHFTTHATSAFV